MQLENQLNFYKDKEEELLNHRHYYMVSKKSIK